MKILPQADTYLGDADHALMHRVVCIDNESPEQSVVIHDDGTVEFPFGITQSWNEEYPSAGDVNGINKTFTFLHTPNFISLEGQLLSTLNGDYSVSVKTIVLTFAPQNNPPINKFCS